MDNNSDVLENINWDRLEGFGETGNSYRSQHRTSYIAGALRIVDKSLKKNRLCERLSPL